MNSFVLMAKIVRSPELRYTPDNQVAVANMILEFDSIGQNESPYNLKAVGWGNLATDINEKYKEGDEVIIEGRLAMNTIDRPEGFKEKKAELIISRIFPINNNGKYSSTTSNNVVPFDNSPSPSVNTSSETISVSEDNNISSTTSPSDLDDIPF